MNRLLPLALLAAGCGPLDRTMPPRLDPAGQKDVDAAWDAALAPVGKHDRRQWLDALVGTQAYQTGVDTLTLRSEKAFAGGRAVMEVSFDRAKPDDDRLVVTVFDREGKAVRREQYTRAEVEQTTKDLLDPNRNTPPQPDDPPEVARQRAETAARWQQVRAMMPKGFQDAPPKAEAK